MRGRDRLSLVGPERLRSVLTVAGVLVVAAGTQVVPTLHVPPAPVSTVAVTLPAVPFDDRIEATLQRLRSGALTDDATDLVRAAVQQGRRLLRVDPDDNQGQGSWAELVGAIDEHTEAVGILVPGSASFVTQDNFDRYHQRAAGLVEQSGGRLALVVWAAGTFPEGWFQSAMSGYARSLGRELAVFSHELRAEIDSRLGPDADVPVVVAGHSFGGAVVGAAERYGLAADAVLHIASAGMGPVGDPYDYPAPDRPRYSMTAPGDLISFVQGWPGPPGFGHGPDPDRFRCVTTLPTGYLPDDPRLRDELGSRLGDRAGARIGGVSSHSEVFIRHSDAWWQMYRVFLGRPPAPDDCPPPEGNRQPHARVLPPALSRVVADGRCRADGVLRPGDRRRLLDRLGRAGRHG